MHRAHFSALQFSRGPMARTLVRIPRRMSQVSGDLSFCCGVEFPPLVVFIHDPFIPGPYILEVILKYTPEAFGFSWRECTLAVL